jgi:glyoxylase-like metal-dependent hydrolase (beta-lactamase superfamily II)
MLFKQLFDPTSSTYTYVLAADTGEAVLIDPVYEHAERDLAFLKNHKLTLAWTLDTHVHADHVTGANTLKQSAGCQTAVGDGCNASGFDHQLHDGDELRFGNEVLRVIGTPGHTHGSVSYQWRDRVFTGDALLIGGCGRTDFQAGSADTLYASITEKLFALAEDTLVYPGHDYNGRRVSSIGEEMALNPRLAGKSRAEFVHIMDSLDLPKPRLIDIAVPANLVGGKV